MNWIVGDVHGCARELEDLLREIRFDRARDVLWSVGDVVNTGPHSAEALRLWLDAGGRGVLGNHDVYALSALSGAIARRPDQLQGLLSAGDGDDLLAALGAWPALARLPGPDGGGRVWLVHAGLHPTWTDLDGAARRIEARRGDAGWLRSEEVAFVTRVRCCTADGDRSRHVGPPEQCPAPYRAWDSFYDGPDLVVHGHWALRGAYRTPRTLGLDSGCVYGGSLTAWSVEDDRIVRVPARNPAGYAGR